MDPDLEAAYRSREAAEAYDSRHRATFVRRCVTHREVRLVAKLLRGLPEGSLVLDAACGAGRIASRLEMEGWEVIGLDASRDMLEKGIGTGSLAAGRTVAGSVFKLPFGGRSVAGGVCIRFLHHLSGRKERLAALGELCRVARGPVVVSVWTAFNLQHLRRIIRGFLGRRSSARRTVDLRLFRKELASAGITVERIRFLYPFVSETVYLLIHPEKTGHSDRS